MDSYHSTWSTANATSSSGGISTTSSNSTPIKWTPITRLGLLLMLLVVVVGLVAFYHPIKLTSSLVVLGKLNSNGHALNSFFKNSHCCDTKLEIS